MEKKLTKWTQWRLAGQAAITESFFRNSHTGPPYRNTVGFLLGFVTALLLLISSQPLGEVWVTRIFAIAVVLIFVLLLLARPYREGALDRFAWGIAAFIVLGFGLGALAYHYRNLITWLWDQQLLYLQVEDKSPRVMLEALFLLGIVMGFLVVRNWSKEQNDFVARLTALLSGAFIASITDKIPGGPPLKDSLAAYVMGTMFSTAVNLLVAARLTAIYTNRKTIVSRALLDFLYGSERARTIDGYFLKNFEEDPDYAKTWLTNSLIEFAKLTKRRFAERMEATRDKRRRGDSARVERAQANLERIKQKISRREDKLPTASDAERKQLKAEIAGLEIQRDELEMAASPEKCYQLVAIMKSEEKKAGAVPSASEDDRPYTISYREVDHIRADMFRVGVSVRWQDLLEYIVAPGEYKGAFPFMGSVAGLALLVRKTIVMDRDRLHRFRSKDFPLGIAPADIEQKRGLDEIDFLSYISVPVVSRLGQSTENGVGILSIDTRIFFATDRELADKPSAKSGPEGEPGTYSVRLTRRQLADFASRLYEHEGKDTGDDPDVKYLEEIVKVIVHLLELYLKCRQGAT